MSDVTQSIDYALARALAQVALTDPFVVGFAIVVVSVIIVIDRFYRVARVQKKDAGLANDAAAVSIDGSRSLPVRDYVSKMQRLAGRPDALISENGFIIPVERKPLARKIRDRHVAQLLVYMRLVEEFEGVKPPYGYVILGSNCRRIRIDNSPERQAWLQKFIDEMREVIATGKAVPTPAPKKCRKCDVRDSCTYRIDAAPPAQPDKRRSLPIV